MILAFATKGTGTNDELRLRALLSETGAEFLPFNKGAKASSGWQLLRTLLRRRPDLVVMEGTGIAGGAACLLARWFAGVPFVFSSGDAVGPFIAGIHPTLGPAFALYERLLYRSCAGFIGWTPYLVGRALTLGAQRGMTAAGWSPHPLSGERWQNARHEVRESLGIDDGTIVFGIVGSLAWNRRYRYCYGAELVRAAASLPASRKIAVIVGGGGSGLAELRRLAQDAPAGRVHLVGELPPDRVNDYLAAMDVASLPQSVDGVGSFRYTTKLSEILAAGLPVVTGQIPLAYDLDGGWLWRLPGGAPWSKRYLTALSDLMGSVTRSAVEARAAQVPRQLAEFDLESQTRRTKAFVEDVMGASRVADAREVPATRLSAAPVPSVVSIK